MYTRCPSCRAEISFEPPANMESLPDGYKHRIKCPSCGVTIGVKINKIDTSATQPTYAPQNPYATSPAPVYYADNAPVAPVAKTKAKADKKSGISRNIFMMICALLFIGLTVVGYLVNNGTIEGGPNDSWLVWFGSFTGINSWELLVNDIDAFALLFDDIAVGIASIIPMVLFTLSCLIFVIDFICACCRKYGRVTNFLFGLVIGGCAVIMLFCEWNLLSLIDISEHSFVAFDQLGSYFEELVGELMQGYLLIAAAALGLIHFIFSCVFLKTLKKKRV